MVTVLLGLMPCAALAQGTGLGLLSAGFSAAGTGMTPFYMLGLGLGPWQEYLAQELTPDYLLDENVAPVRVSWLRSSDVSLLPDFARGLGVQQDTYLQMNFERQSARNYIAPRAQPDVAFQASRFERQYFSPGIEHRTDDNGVLGVAAVIAYQRYSTAGLGMISAVSADNLAGIYAGYRPFEESGFGTGVNLALRQEITRGFAVETGFQSKIDMEEFAAYRGVYSNPADLDIPARARVGLEFKASQRSWLNVAVERVMYSEISAFPSRFLPNRLLSLLGDSTSPAFEWDDLTVYTVGWAWSDGEDQQWNVNVSTRPQPSPSSLLLSQALGQDIADKAVTFGYTRRTSSNGRLNVNAAYAPAEYAFGGSVLGVTTDDLGQQFELEALWTVKF